MKMSKTFCLFFLLTSWVVAEETADKKKKNTNKKAPKVNTKMVMVDKTGDGKITKEDFIEKLHKQFAAVDTDGNGELNDFEKDDFMRLLKN